MRRPRRETARVARAATPIATIARSAGGSGRTTARNWSARARSITPEERPSALGQPDRLHAPVVGLLAPLEEPAPDQAVDQPRRRRRRAVERVGEVGDRGRAAVGDRVERGQLGEAEAQLPELGGEPDHELPPEGLAERDPLGQLARVLDPRRGRPRPGPGGRRRPSPRARRSSPARRAGADAGRRASGRRGRGAAVRRPDEARSSRESLARATRFVQGCTRFARGAHARAVPCIRAPVRARASRSDPVRRASRAGSASRRSAVLGHEEPHVQPRVRLPRPGLAGRRHGPRARRRLARRGRRLRRRPTTPSASPSPGWPGTARPRSST